MVNKRTGNKCCRHAAVKYRQGNTGDVKMIILEKGGGGGVSLRYKECFSDVRQDPSGSKFCVIRFPLR